MLFVYIILGLIGIFILENLVRFFLFKCSFIPVLMYHRINDYERNKEVRYVKHKGAMLDIDSMKVKVSSFKEQLAYLNRKHYQSVTMDEYNELNSHKRKGKYVAITFDDGYEDNYLYAYPLLLDNKMKATIFITTGTNIMPVDQNDTIENNKLLNWTQIKEMRAHGFAFGGHTVNHQFLTEVDDLEIIEQEIVGCKEKINEELAYQAKSFAYPAGLFNDEIINIVNKYYDNAVITAYGRKIPLINSDPYKIEREAISRTDSLFMFKLKLWGVHRFIRKSLWYQGLRRLLRWLR